MRIRYSLLILAALVGPVVEAQDSTAKRTAALAGMVRDPFGRPLKDATISVDRTELKAFTNDSGFFFLKDIPPGMSDFSVLKVGYGAVHFRIDLSVDSTLVLNIPMKAVQTLASVDVKGEQVSAKLMRAGYYERRNQGLGSFIGPDKIERQRAATMPSNFLRDTRNVRVICKTNGFQGCIVRMGSKIDIQSGVMTGCTPNIFVNGLKRTGEFDEIVNVGEVYAIEVYERRALIPMNYMPSECAIGVWTKTFADAPNQKP